MSRKIKDTYWGMQENKDAGRLNKMKIKDAGRSKKIWNQRCNKTKNEEKNAEKMKKKCRKDENLNCKKLRTKTKDQSC